MPFKWRMQRRNNTKQSLSGQCSMRLTAPTTLVRSVFASGMQQSSDHKFFLPSLFPLFPPRETCWLLQKKKKQKKVRLFVCYVKLGLHYFDYNIFDLESFIELILFFNFIIWHLIFISDLILIFLIAMYLVFN